MLKIGQIVQHLGTGTFGQVVSFVEVEERLFIKVAIGGMCFITGHLISFRGLDNS